MIIAHIKICAICAKCTASDEIEVGFDTEKHDNEYFDKQQDVVYKYFIDKGWNIDNLKNTLCPECAKRE